MNTTIAQPSGTETTAVGDINVGNNPTRLQISTKSPMLPSIATYFWPSCPQGGPPKFGFAATKRKPRPAQIPQARKPHDWELEIQDWPAECAEPLAMRRPASPRSGSAQA